MFGRAVLMACLCMLVFACCKEDKECEDPGLGGSVTLICSPEHHGDAIPGATIFIKFDSDQFPGENPAAYHVSYTATTPDDITITIPGLKCGQYYVYSTGYDSTVFDNVKGGIPYTIDQKEGTISIAVPVTED